ncbi:CocE/NonD family hydrolase [Candidatus Protochlamydia amoebophila]|nr:CocE/NonD family hydrolase [Candidatus Protochlamydia amoebophila]
MMIRLYTCIFVFLLNILGSEELKPDLTIMVPMRDGVSLPTDLYLPTPEARNLPCILIRSPAGRDSTWKSFASMAKAGYVIAIQDTRSVLDLEGKTFPFLSDGWGKLQDGYDAVEWLAKSPYTNGKIGTWGSSAVGITQLLLAPTQPPHLVCQYIIVAAASLYHHGLFPGGLLLKHQAESWLGYYARDTGVLNYVSQRPFYNEFWKQLNTSEMAHRVKIPGMLVAGWYDTFLQGTLDAFEARQREGEEGAKGKQKLIIGPWTHFWPLSNHFGDFKIPVAGENPPMDISPKRWFDHYLKGEVNEVESLPPILYYVMGPFDGSTSSGNIWRTSEVWPVPTVATAFYLTSQHTLQQTPPSLGLLAYTYDPTNPIPTRGGRNLFLESGPVDQQNIEKRKDILVFTTHPLKEDLEITGKLSAKLFVSSDQQDSDIVVHLTDVYPDGKSVLISEGGIRLGVFCYQNDSKIDLKPGQPIEVDLDLWSTSLVFAKGHSIRISISSSNYPRYEKNLNVGLIGSQRGEFKSAHNTIYMGEKYPSQLILPVVRKGETWLTREQPSVKPMENSL